MSNLSAQDVILGLMTALTPDVVKLVEQQLGATSASNARQAYNDACAFFRRSDNTDNVDVYEGFVELGGQRLDVEFVCPCYASRAEIDSALITALAPKTSIGHKKVRTMGGL